MKEAQQSLETRILAKEKKKLISYVYRLTGCRVFPNINHIAEVAESNQYLLELLIGAVSIAYHTGRLGKNVDYDTICYFPNSLTKIEVKTFLQEIYTEAKSKYSEKSY